MDNIEYVIIRGGVVEGVAVLSANNTDTVCYKFGIKEEERGDFVFIRDYDSVDESASNYVLDSCWSVFLKPSAQVARDEAERAMEIVRKKQLYAEFRDPKGKALRLRPLHGRENPDEDMEEMGPSGDCLYFDWIHVTYLSDFSIGTKNKQGAKIEHFCTNVAVVVRFEKGCLRIDDGEKVMFYGDWEIDAAGRLLASTTNAYKDLFTEIDAKDEEAK